MKKSHYGSLILLCLLFCCKKDNGPGAFSEASYPLAVGNWWQYEITSFYGEDTFMLSAVSVTNVGPYVEYKCNISSNGTVIDSGYFLQSDTSMSFINTSIAPDYSPFPNFHLRFPVTTGQYWQGSFPGDSILVDAVVGSEGYYGHTYGPCYLTTESYDLPHNYKVESMTLTPKVGLVHQSITFNSDTAEPIGGIPGVQIQQSISLINYHVQ